MTASSTATPVEVLIRRLDEGLPLPTYAHPWRRRSRPGDGGRRAARSRGSARGSCRPARGRPGPDGYAAVVHPFGVRLAALFGVGIVNAPGTVDAGATAARSRCCSSTTTGTQQVTLSRGDRIAQLVVQRVERARFHEVALAPRVRPAARVVTGPLGLCRPASGRYDTGRRSGRQDVSVFRRRRRDEEGQPDASTRTVRNLISGPAATSPTTRRVRRREHRRCRPVALERGPSGQTLGHRGRGRPGRRRCRTTSAGSDPRRRGTGDPRRGGQHDRPGHRGDDGAGRRSPPAAVLRGSSHRGIWDEVRTEIRPASRSRAGPRTECGGPHRPRAAHQGAGRRHQRRTAGSVHRFRRTSMVPPGSSPGALARDRHRRRPDLPVPRRSRSGAAHRWCPASRSR